MENQRQWVKVLLGVVAFVLVLCLGMAIGGLIVFGVTQVADDLPWVKSKTEPGVLLDLPEEPSTRVVTPGAVIVEVVPGGPADEAGLQVGDVIQAVDGQRITAEESLADLIAAFEPGDRVTLTLQRQDETAQRVRVKLGEHPDREGAAYLGVTYSTPQGFNVPGGEPLPFGELDEFDPGSLPGWLPRGAGRGVMITEVVEDSPAADAGLERGDIVTAVDGVAVGSPQALANEIAGREPGERITLTVYRFQDQEEREVEVRLGEHPDQEGKAYLGVGMGGAMWRFQSPGSEGDGPPSGGLQLELPFAMPLDELPWDRLPFDLDQLPFDLDELPGGFEFHWPPGGEDCDGGAGCNEGGSL